MARRSSDRGFASTPLEADVARYRPFCGLAIVGLVVGWLSALAILDPLLWFLPVLGVVLSAIALRRIAASDPPLVGRTAAVAGLGLSVAFAVAAPTDFYYSRWTLRQEAREFGLQWFQLLANDEPEKACQLYESPASRQPLDETLWDYYPLGSESRATLESFVTRRAAHALLLLRNGAQVRYYDTDGQWTNNGRDCVAQTFAVTFSSEGETQTFFVRLTMERSQVEGQRRGFWRVLREEEGFVPAALGGKPPPVGA